MPETVASTIARLRHLSVGELQALYAETFDHSPRTRNKDFLWRRIAWELQAQRAGGLSQPAQERITELIAEHDPLADAQAKSRRRRKPGRRRRPRPPRPATVIRREYKGETHDVTIVEGGVEYRGRRYRSLSAIAKVITGAHWNGPLFFGLR